MKKILCLPVILLTLMTIYGEPDFQSKLKNIDDIGNFKGMDFSCVYTFVSEKPGEEPSVNQARMFRRDDMNQFVLLFLKPEVKKGQGYLQVDDNVWFYDPESRKFEKSTIKEDIQDSEAKNSDLNRNSLADDYLVVKWEEGKLGSVDTYILDLDARHDDVSYKKIRIWIRKDRDIVLKEQDYSVSDRLMRSVYYPHYMAVGEKYLPSQILIVDELNKGEKSQVTLKDASVAKLPDKVFTKAYIEAVNNQ